MNTLNPIPMAISVEQAVLVLLTLVGSMWVLRLYAYNRFITTIVRVWVFFTAFASWKGVFNDLSSTPPPFFLFLAGQMLFLLFFIFVSAPGRALTRIPQWILIGGQAFRIGVELILAQLAAEGLLAHELTFRGVNQDIWSGILGLGLALLIRKVGVEKCRTAMIAYNFVGLALLFNIVVRAIGSAPTPFQFLHYPVDTWVVTVFPMQWLPFFLVPLALAMHLISLKKLFSRAASLPA
jgi:hypothetical protein